MYISGKETKVIHEFKPFYNENSEILILGSIPSVKSREIGFYYSHPQNRFFKILADVFNEDVPKTIEDKKLFLTKHKIALWDVIKSCNIKGSSDSSIKNVVVNDISTLIKNTKITRIYTTGKKAFELYNKYIFNKTLIKAIYLPSSSPANQSIKYNNIVNIYKEKLNEFVL